MACKSNKTLVTCRYCLTNTNKHILQYFSLDELNRYEKKLEETFNIQVFFSENKYVCLLCQEDIRNAAEVKKRILDVQKSLLEQSEKLNGFRPETPKEEIISDYEDTNFDNGVCDNGIRDDGVGHNAKGDSGNTEAFSAKSDVQNNITNIEVKQIEIDIPPWPESKTYAKLNLSHKSNVRNKQSCTKDTENGRRRPLRAAKSVIQTRKNTMTLINNSNLCLFNSKKTKYSCYNCKEVFLEIQKLRAHSLTHKTDKIEQAIRQCRGLSLKNVDISNLACKKCSHPCTDLEELRVHLQKEHDETFEGTSHFLLPFRLEHGFKCVVCQKELSNFTTLTIHMNCHSKANVCEICGLPFSHRRNLRNHILHNHTGNQCSICLLVLPTSVEKKKHLRVVHNKSTTKRYCNHCDEIFRYCYQLKEHMVDKHGVEKRVHVCEVCNKEFVSAVGVKTHYKSVHLGERNYDCSLCDMSFFTSCDKRRHERTHGSDKPFACDLCKVRFGTKDSMGRHMKRKHGDTKVKHK